MFLCNNSRYISQSLKSNSFNPCGDHSDGDNITCLLQREQTTLKTTSISITKLTGKPTTTGTNSTSTLTTGITFGQRSTGSSMKYMRTSSVTDQQRRRFTPCIDFPKCLSSKLLGQMKDAPKTSNLSTGAIVGISIGFVALMFIVITVVVLWRRRHGALRNTLQRQLSTAGNLASVDHDYTQLEEQLPTDN